MQLDRADQDAPAAPTVAEFLRNLLAGRLDAATDHISPDMVFLGRKGWNGDGTPFRQDARLQEGSLRQLPPEDVARVPLEEQREAFEAVIAPNEYVFFAVIRTAGSFATLGIITRRVNGKFLIARLFDTKNVKAMLLAVN